MSTLSSGLVLVLWNPTALGVRSTEGATIGYVNNDRPLTLATQQELVANGKAFRSLTNEEKALVPEELRGLQGLPLPKSSQVGNQAFAISCEKARLRGGDYADSRLVIPDEDPPNGYWFVHELLAQTVVPDEPATQTQAQLIAAAVAPFAEALESAQDTIEILTLVALNGGSLPLATSGGAYLTNNNGDFLLAG